jgi:hypothetical protein
VPSIQQRARSPNLIGMKAGSNKNKAKIVCTAANQAVPSVDHSMAHFAAV